LSVKIKINKVFMYLMGQH